MHAQPQALRHARGLGFHGDAMRREQIAQRQLLCAVRPALDLESPAAAGQGLQFVQQVLLAHGPGLAAFPQAAHHGVERVALGFEFAAQRQVQAQRHQRAFGVVTHGGVDGVFVLAVVLDPGVKAGLRHALHMAAGGLLHLQEGLAQQSDVGGVVDQSCAAQQDVVVIAGEAFKEPQQLRVVLLAVVVAGKGIGAQLLDVPGVKVLVADQAQQRGVALWLAWAGGQACVAWQIIAFADQGSAVAVLQPAIAVMHGVEHEKVVFVRRFFTRCLARSVPEMNRRLADFLRVGQQALAVKGGQSTGHHKAVRHTAGVEAAAPERAQLHRAVHQFVVVRGLVQAKAFFVGFERRQARGRLPTGLALHGLQLQLVRRLFLSVHPQAHTRAIEEAALAVEPSGAHRVVKGIDLVAQHQRLPALASDGPAALVLLLCGQTAPALLGAQVLQVFGKLTHQITARNPHRQRHGLLRRWLRNSQRDLEQMRMQVGGFNGVVDGGHGQ